MPESPPSGPGIGQLGVIDTKHMPVAVSQQLESAPTGGQAFWQSRSVVHGAEHIPPPVELLVAAAAAVVLGFVWPDVALVPDAPPNPPSKSSVSLPDAQATMSAEGSRARANMVTLVDFTGL